MIQRKAGLLREVLTVAAGTLVSGSLEWYWLRSQSSSIRRGMLIAQAVGFCVAFYAVGNHGKKKHQTRMSKENKSSENMLNMKNPFVNRTWILTPMQRFKIAFNAVTIFPVRLVVLISAVVANVLLSNIVLFGISRKDLATKPLPMWRARIRDIIAVPLCRVLLWALGVWNLKRIGSCASTNEAPVIVAAPHICFLEPLAVMGLHCAMGVSRAENAAIPLFGAITKATQAILVDRMDPDSKKKTSQTISLRARSREWRYPIALFPEGTTHSQSCLVHFKSGAFRPGVPVQIVVVRMPWRFESPAWGAGGPSLPGLVFRSMCQYIVHLELEYLPVRKPRASELEDATEFARHAQRRVADSLGVPCTEHSIADVILSNAARKMKVSPAARASLVTAASTVELGELDKIIECDVELAKEYLTRFSKFDKDGKGYLTCDDFKTGFRIDDDDIAKSLFHLMDHDDSGRIDFKEFLLGVTILNGRGQKNDPKKSFRQAVEFAFDAFDSEKGGSIPLQRFANLIRKAFPGSRNRAIFQRAMTADSNGDGSVSKSEFVALCEALETHKEAFRDAHFGSIFVARPTPRRKKEKSA